MFSWVKYLKMEGLDINGYRILWLKNVFLNFDLCVSVYVLYVYVVNVVFVFVKK